MLPSRFLSRHVAGAALSCAVLAAPRATPAQMYAPPSAPVVVSTDWLGKHLNDPNLVLLHVGDRKEYDAGHIPGARYVALDDISVSSHDHDKGLMLEMPKPDSLRARLEALGISSDSRVIVYYGNDWVSPATRVIFTLDYAGLGAGSALLDGGMPAWKAEKRALSTAAPKPSRGQLAALSVKPIIVDAAWVRSRLGSPSFHLIDGRAAVFYDGVETGGSRKGHIPGAKSLPYTEIADDNLSCAAPPSCARCSRERASRRATPSSAIVTSASRRRRCCSPRARSVIRCSCTTARIRTGRAAPTFRSRIRARGRRAPMSARVASRPYADPYLAGVGLGLVLLASFVLAGRGLGASGAFATAAATSVQAVAPGADRRQSVSRAIISPKAARCATGSSSSSSA